MVVPTTGNVEGCSVHSPSSFRPTKSLNMDIFVFLRKCELGLLLCGISVLDPSTTKVSFMRETIPGIVPRLSRSQQKYSTTTFPFTKASDKAGLPIGQHFIHEPSFSTKVNKHLSSSFTVPCMAETTVIIPWSVTPNGDFHRPTNPENSLMHSLFSILKLLSARILKNAAKTLDRWLPKVAGAMSSSYNALILEILTILSSHLGFLPSHILCQKEPDAAFPNTALSYSWVLTKRRNVRIQLNSEQQFSEVLIQWLYIFAQCLKSLRFWSEKEENMHKWILTICFARGLARCCGQPVLQIRRSASKNNEQQCSHFPHRHCRLDSFFVFSTLEALPTFDYNRSDTQILPLPPKE